MSKDTSMPPLETRAAASVIADMTLVERAISHLDINGRINILGYCIAGYVAAEFEPGERVAMTKKIGKAITFDYLPAMETVQRQLGGDTMGPAKGSA